MPDFKKIGAACGLLLSLFSLARSEPAETRTEQALFVHLPLHEAEMGGSTERRAIEELSDQLARIVTENGLGEFDGDEWGQGWCILFMYGESADQLYEAMSATIAAHPSSIGGFAVRRYGPADGPGIQEVRTLF